MPHLGLIDEGAVILRWLKGEGDALIEGEPVLQVETAKSNVDIEAPASGNLARIVLKEGDTANVGALLAEIAVPSAAAGASREWKAPSGHEKSPKGELNAALTVPAEAEPAAAAARIRCTPAVRRRAEELGIPLETVTGTGPRGRIELRDLEAASAARSPRQELSAMRRTIARAMADSASSIPQFTVSRQVLLEQCDNVKKALDADLHGSGYRLSLTDFLVNAAARALMAHPSLNAAFVGSPDDADAFIQRMASVHIGLVVAVRDGFLVPVLRHVEKLSIGEIARLRSDVVERARSGVVRPSELGGAVFSISNLGAAGPDRFTALVNPGQSAILAVGRRREVAVAEKGQLAVRAACELTLTVDHRLTDGRGATDFLNALAGVLESPEL